MKKIIFLGVLFLIFGVVGMLFLKRNDSLPISKESSIRVVVSSYVPYVLLKELAGNLIQLEMLLPPNAEIHGFEPAPGSIISVKQAKLFVYLSEVLEPWAMDLVNSASTTHSIKLSNFVPKQEDPHVWMNFDNWYLMAESMEKELENIDILHKEIYAKNLTKLSASIKTLNQAYQNVLANCTTKTVVHVGHSAFGLLAKNYGLTLLTLDATSHQGEPSAKKLVQLVEQIRQQQIKFIFSEEEVSPRLVDALSYETGAKMLPLFTVEHISKKDFLQQVSYEDLMFRNLENLERGLQCKVS